MGEIIMFVQLEELYINLDKIVALSKYGLSVNVDDINNWDMSVAFPQLTKQQIVEILYDKEDER